MAISEDLAELLGSPSGTQAERRALAHILDRPDVQDGLRHEAAVALHQLCKVTPEDTEWFVDFMSQRARREWSAGIREYYGTSLAFEGREDAGARAAAITLIRTDESPRVRRSTLRELTMWMDARAYDVWEETVRLDPEPAVRAAAIEFLTDRRRGPNSYATHPQFAARTRDTLFQLLESAGTPESVSLEAMRLAMLVVPVSELDWLLELGRRSPHAEVTVLAERLYHERMGE